jgi:hypothetical protein
MRLFHRIACCLALGLGALAPTLNAEAATLGTADFRPGQTIGVGLAGLSYDFAFPRVDLGASLSTNNWSSPAQGRMLIGTRGLVRFLEQRDLSAALVGGVLFDPGFAGDRSYLVPDLGLGVAYRFNLAGFPLALRFNVTLTVDQGQTQPYPVPVSPEGTITQPRGNVLQRLTTGPNTMVGLAYMPTDNMEITVGGGTLVGVRFTY